MKTLLPLAVAAVAGLVSAQSPLSTFAQIGPANNGLGSGSGVYFDLEALNSPLFISDLNIETTSTTVNPQITVWTCAGSLFTADPVSGLAPVDDPSVWTNIGTFTGTVPAAGGGAITPIDVADFQIPQGTTGFFVVYDNISLRYFGTGSGSTATAPATVSNSDVILTTGGSGSSVGGGFGNFPRLFMGEIAYFPAAGLFPSFTQDVSSGPSPLAVNFTDTTFTDDPAGLTSVDFDFENDGTFDASTTAGGTVSNTFACGTWDVLIQATDSVNGTATNLVAAAVVTDAVTASFTQDQPLIGTGQIVNFSATATPGATLEWDFDGDGMVDDVNPIASFVYTTAGTFNISLTATLACNSVTETSSIEVIAGAILSPGLAGGFTSFTSPPDASYFDVNITNPVGYVVEEIFHRSTQTNQLHEMEVYIQTVPGRSVVGFEAASNFTLISSGSATSGPNSSELFRVDVQDFILPPGITGMAVVSRNSGSGTTWYIGNSGLTASNADITITPQTSNSNFDTAGNSLTDPDSWSGGFVGTGVNDLLPNFSVDVTGGASPLAVQFTDTSLTNDPAGVTTWAWDFQNDGTVDDTTQNPAFTYAACGDFSVKLDVSDSLNGLRTVTQTDLISVDQLTASFTQDAGNISVGGTVNFTYTGTAGAVVDWDLDGDGTNETSGTNVSFVYSTLGVVNISMTATLNCRQEVVPGTVNVLPQFVEAPMNTGTFTDFTTAPDCAYFDIEVTNFQGVTVTNVGTRSSRPGELHDFEIWGILGTSVDDNFGVADFVLLGTGQFTPTVSDELVVVDVPDFTLPYGVHGMATVHRDVAGSDAGHTWYVGNAGQSNGDANITITPRGSDTNFDTQTSDTGISSTSNSFAGAIFYSEGGAPPTPGQIAPLADGCPGSLGQSDLSVIAPIAIGTTAGVRCSNVLNGAWLHTGNSNSFNPSFGVPLPFDLQAALGAQAGCVFRTSSEILLVALPDAFGDATFSFPIPNTPAFSGVLFFQQATVFDANIPGTVAVSDAYFGVIQ